MHPLHLFPTAGFDRSTTTPVLVGLLISWFFTETFGWVFAGLVVPGYLAAVFAIDPRAGVVDVAEAIFTYGLARAIGEHLPRTGLTSRVFGRERFLLIVLSSIIVRLAVEGALLPRFAPHAAGAFFSIGLVVVPLAANACWKTGLGKGLVQNGVPTLLTFLLLRYVLLPHTNLSLAGFELATEDVAASFLDSPKAYILLITGAILAAAANLLDGWDFNGILVPALLSLVVLEPVKLGATFVEAILLVMVATALLRHTRLGRANIEGPRRLVLFFTIDYAMRFAFAAIVGRSLPGADVVGLMGFGYLLPTLLAVKIAQRGSVAVVILPTAHVGVFSFALGTLIGFAAAIVDTAPSAARTAVTRPLAHAPIDPEAAGMWIAALARTTPHEGTGPSPVDPQTLVGLVDDAVSKDPTKAAPSPLVAEQLDRGVVLLRERFQMLEDRFGDPAVLVTASGRAPGRHVVVLVDQPVTAPEHGALAGRFVAAGRVDAAVIAQIETSDGSSFGPAALASARALAGEHGAVIAIRRTTEKAPRVVLKAESPPPARVEALVVALEASLGPLVRQVENPDGVDAIVELPDAAVATLVTDKTEAPPSIASPTALSSTLSDAHATTEWTALEDLMALRRLLLDPLLGPTASNVPVPQLRARARKLGYELLGPSPLGDGGEGLVLRPVAPRPIALLVRVSGVAKTIIEVPHGFHDDTRDAATRLATAMHADAVLFGLEHGGGARGGAGLRLAHAVASSRISGRDPQIVLLREGDDAPPGKAAVGAWGGAARGSLSNGALGALRALGVESEERPLGIAARELGGRALFGDTPLAVITLDRTALARLSLDESRFAARSLAVPSFNTFDGSLVDAAKSLLGSIPAGLTAPSADVVDLARRTTAEQSVTARRALEKAISSSAARAGVVRTARGDFLLVVARNEQGWLTHASPIDPRAAGPEIKTTKVASLRECAEVLDAAGTCLAAHP